jgi:PAS domain S-box-containing protein
MSATNDLAQQQSLLGFAVLVLKISELVEESSIEENSRVLMHIEDISDPDHIEEIYGVKQESNDFSRTEVLTVASRNWRITTYNDAAEKPSTLSEWLVLISGLMLSGVITLGIYSLIRRREIVESQVNKRTSELQASEEQHRAVVENAVDGLLTIDEIGTIEKFNQAAQRIFGYAPEEVIGVNIKILMPEPYHGEHDGYLKNYRDTGVKKIIGIGRYVQGKRKDGTIFPIELSVSEMNFGSIKKFSGIVRDVSERVALEKERDSFTEQLIESEEQHRAVVENAVDGLLTINEIGIIEKFNQAAQKIFGYSPEEVIGVNIKILMPEPYHGEHDGYLQSYRDTGVKKIIGIGRYVQGKRKDGTIFPIELSVSEMYFGSTRKFSGIIRDVSARVEQEEEREKLIDKLTDSNEELERFAFVCSHDLQEPLRMVRSFSEKLQDHIADSLEHDVKGKKYFNFVIDGAARAQTLITDILTYSSISTDTHMLERVSIEQIITIIKSNMLDTAERTTGSITFDPLPYLQGNKTQLFQLFQNLINNGLKYQRPDVEPHVHISVEDSGQHWTFSIKDNGIGMEKRHLKKIFEVFQRLHRRSQYAGTGVGLSICKKVTERHGGIIWVESEKGVGSTFYVKLLKPTIIEDLS